MRKKRIQVKSSILLANHKIRTTKLIHDTVDIICGPEKNYIVVFENQYLVANRQKALNVAMEIAEKNKISLNIYKEDFTLQSSQTYPELVNLNQDKSKISELLPTYRKEH